MYIFVDIDHKEAVELMTDVTTIDTVFYEDIETGNIEVAKYINWSFNPQGEGNFIGDYLFLRRMYFDMDIWWMVVSMGLKTVAKSGYKVGDL